MTGTFKVHKKKNQNREPNRLSKAGKNSGHSFSSSPRQLMRYKGYFLDAACYDKKKFFKK